MKSNEPKWYALAQPLLGKVPDSHIAEKLGISHTSVQRRRTSLGIPAIKKQGRRKWSATRPPVHAVIIPLLGHMPDLHIARQLGVKRNIVQKIRLKLRIPPAGFGRWKKHSIEAIKPPKKPLEWHAKAQALFGTMSDTNIAKQLGLAVVSVQKYRNFLQVPVFRIGRAFIYNYTSETVDYDLIALQDEYAIAADIRRQHPQRYTPEYQQYLCDLRDKLALALHLSPQQVQDGYGTLRARLNMPVIPPESTTDAA